MRPLGLWAIGTSASALKGNVSCHARSQHGSPGVLTTYQGGWALTPEAARWARSTVWSRAFTVHQLAGSSAVVALVPVLDMIDHSPDVEVVWHTGPDGSEDFQFATLTPVKQVGKGKAGVLGGRPGRWKDACAVSQASNLAVARNGQPEGLKKAVVAFFSLF